MGYFEIQEDVRVGYAVDRYPVLDSEVSFIEGESLSLSRDATLQFGMGCPGEQFPGHFFPGIIPVMSARFIQMLRAAGIDNFQVFPAILEGLGGAQWHDYFAFNAIGIVDSLDLKKSDGIEIMPGGEGGELPLCDFSYPVVDPKKARGRLMFREARMPRLLVFDDQLEKFIVKFRPPEGWGIQLQYLNERHDPKEVAPKKRRGRPSARNKDETKARPKPKIKTKR